MAIFNAEPDTDWILEKNNAFEVEAELIEGVVIVVYADANDNCAPTVEVITVFHVIPSASNICKDLMRADVVALYVCVSVNVCAVSSPANVDVEPLAGLGIFTKIEKSGKFQVRVMSALFALFLLTKDHLLDASEYIIIPPLTAAGGVD